MSPKAPNLKSVQRLFKPKRKKRKNIKVGLAPGTLVYTGEKELQQVNINLITYDDFELLEESIQLSELEQRVSEKKRVLWIDVVGLHDVDILEKIGLLFNIHKLTMEDILNVDQRPKLEAFDDYIFAALKMIQCQSPESPIDDEQISFVLKDGILLTFQEKKGDVFQSVRNRLADQKRAIRQRKADYLLYALLDAVIDNYFIVMENVGERIENLESQAMLAPDNQTLNALYVQRREMMDLRRTVYPLREVIGSFDKYADDKISAETRPFIRDLYENTIQVIETMEVFRDMSSGVLDLYMNSLSNRMNNIMKVLTIISTIFIPLSFVAGVYGMNFDHMPELHFRYGYFYVIGGMALAVLGMLYFFRRKDWI